MPNYVSETIWKPFPCLIRGIRRIIVMAERTLMKLPKHLSEMLWHLSQNIIPVNICYHCLDIQKHWAECLGHAWRTATMTFVLRQSTCFDCTTSFSWEPMLLLSFVFQEYICKGLFHLLFQFYEEMLHDFELLSKLCLGLSDLVFSWHIYKILGIHWVENCLTLIF